MPYTTQFNTGRYGSSSFSAGLIKEMNMLRAELDDFRMKYSALHAALLAATATGAGYSSGSMALGPRQFTS